jgi:DNA end-binding protein Ku
MRGIRVAPIGGMATRFTWRGLFRLSLITVPIRAFPATKADSDVSFHQFHRKCKTRIQLRKWCPHCEEPVDTDDLVKGYETAKGKYVFVEDEEVKRLRPESTKTIAVSDVVDRSALDPRYIERTYYLAPDSKEARSPFMVIREALAGKAAVGRLALHGREYLTAVVADDRGMTMHTLRTAGEVRSQSEIDDLDIGGVRVKPEEVKLARRVLETFETDADLETFVDNYQAALRDMLKKKGAGEPLEAEEEPAPTKVVNLMDALRQSLEQVKGSPRKKARVLKHATKPKMRRAS